VFRAVPPSTLAKLGVAARRATLTVTALADWLNTAQGVKVSHVGVAAVLRETRETSPARIRSDAYLR